MHKCNYCSKYLSTVNLLISHMKIFHRCQENGIFYCSEEECNRHFPTLKTYRKHLKTHINTSNCAEKTTAECSSCDNACVPDLDLEVNSSIIVYENGSTNELFNFEELFNSFQQQLSENNVLFISSLYSKNRLCRKDVDLIMTDVSHLLSGPLNKFKEYVVNHISNTYKFSCQHHAEMEKFFSAFAQLFDSLNTEYQRFQYLTKVGSYVPPETYVIGQHLQKDINLAPVPKNYTIEFIPLRDVLEKFLCLPDVLNEILKYVETLSNEKYIQNIVQTKLWREKTANFKTDPASVVLPLLIYYDDFECGNPLGSHAGIHKIGAVYCSIACLPLNVQSRVENIFLALLFHSADLKEFGETVVFAKLIEELNFLCNQGVQVHLSDQNIRIYFCLLSFIGDNLALNTILGFQQSFISNSFCRFCKLTRVQTHYSTIEESAYLRNFNNYQKDISINVPYLTGIKYSPSLNNVRLFHVTENYAVDIAHDIYEGVGALVMSNLLYQFIIIDKFFTFERLNHKIEFFNFNENHNKPPLLSLDQLKKRSIRMSASEMKHFILNSSLIFGHLIPEGNKHWELYLLMRKILRIVLSQHVTLEMPDDLSLLIKTFNTLYLELFSVPLKPKQHFLTHYPTLMKKIGPLSQTCTLRYESKHRTLKLAANIVASRLNITHTVAIKHQLQLTYRFMAKRGFSDFVEASSSTRNCTKTIKNIITSLTDISQLPVCEKLKSFENNTEVLKICVNSQVFRRNGTVSFESGGKLLFGSIHHLLVNDNKEICLIYAELNIISFNNHLFSYEVSLPEGNVLLCVAFFDDVLKMNTCTIVNRNGLKFIS